MKQADLLKKLALGFVFIWFFVGGLGHFLITDFFVSIVPPWFPWALEVVYVTGVFELAGAFGILWQVTRRWAGLGLFALTLGVTPSNIYMWLNPEQFSQFPEPLLGLRLLVQVFLLFCIWWAAIRSS